MKWNTLWESLPGNRDQVARSVLHKVPFSFLLEMKRANRQKLGISESSLSVCTPAASRRVGAMRCSSSSDHHLALRLDYSTMDKKLKQCAACFKLDPDLKACGRCGLVRPRSCSCRRRVGLADDETQRWYCSKKCQAVKTIVTRCSEVTS